MPNGFSARIKFVSIVVLIVGMVSAALAYSLKRANGVKLRPKKGFTIVTKETTTFSDPKVAAAQFVDHVITVRYQKSDGTFKQVRTYYKANDQVFKEDIGFGIPERGVFQIDKVRGVLNFLSSMPPKEKSSYATITNGHDHPNFLKDDSVQGYETYVLRFPDKDGGYMDMYCATELDGQPIKEVAVFPGGIAVTELQEIKLGDPDDKVFGSLPDWFVDYDRFKQKIKAMEDDGKHEPARAMREELDKRLAKQLRDQ